MGWGTSTDHEGFGDDQRADGTWTAGTSRGPQDTATAKRAACSCGWRSERVHRIGPVPTDPGARAAHFEILEAADEACLADWEAEHWLPLLNYDPGQLLIAARAPGGTRHFLAGQPVHAGETLELLLPRGHWQPIRYETRRNGETITAVAYLTLGGPPAAHEHDALSHVSFELPTRALLRWPTT